MFMDNDVDKIISRLEKGYCLWVGNGVTAYLSTIGDDTVPMWSTLVKELGEDVGININEYQNIDYPTMLKIIKREMKHKKFQQMLREKINDKLSSSIMQSVKKSLSTSNLVPIQATRLGKLGMLANPIINFNVETMTSWAIASPGGSFKMNVFNPPIPNSTNNLYVSASKTSKDKYCRHVYHPHGAIDFYGTCVMTSDEYLSLNGTLALQVAVHSSFLNNLVIVGMSLEDDYLRKQIEIFRPYIKNIYYFTSNDEEKMNKWAHINDIEIIHNEWDDFWEKIVEKLPTPPRLEILETWKTITGLAYDNFSGGKYIADLIDFCKSKGDTDQDLVDQYLLGTNQGIKIGISTLNESDIKDKNRIQMAILKEKATIIKQKDPPV